MGTVKREERSATREARSRTATVNRAIAVMMEQDQAFLGGRLLAFGMTRARVCAANVLRTGAPVVLTVTVPETSVEKTQAVFRLSSMVGKKKLHRTRPETDRHEYVLQFDADTKNLENAVELFARFRLRGIVER